MMAALEHSRGKVAITGSSGILGQRLYTALQADGWEVVGLGLAEGVSQGGPGRDGASETRNEFVDIACNLSMACPDLSGFTHVVHLAGVGSPDASFEQVLRGNVVATQHVLEAAKRSGTVKRVVLASTNHVQTGMCMARGGPGTLDHPNQDPTQWWSPIEPHDEFEPDSFYAASKVHMEMLGKLYGKTWQCFEVVALRIGWCLYDDPTELAGTQYESYLRAMWLSRRDWVGFATAALTAPIDATYHGYIVAHAVSNNPTGIFDIEESTRLLGYTPQDSSGSFAWPRAPVRLAAGNRDVAAELAAAMPDARARQRMRDVP